MANSLVTLPAGVNTISNFPFRAPNKTEFFDNLADLLAEYNGTLPGSNIPNAVVGDGAFWTLAVAMLAMGLATDPAQVLKYLKKPVGPLIGMLCQFVIMPCLAMIFLAAAEIGTYEALVIMLYGCAPGGGIRYCNYRVLKLNPRREITKKLSCQLSLKKRGEAKSAQQSFASKIQI